MSKPEWSPTDTRSTAAKSVDWSRTWEELEGAQTGAPHQHIPKRRRSYYAAWVFAVLLLLLTVTGLGTAIWHGAQRIIQGYTDRLYAVDPELNTPPPLGASATSGRSTAQILKDLRSLPQGVGWPESRYYDMHGNANGGLQTLMIRRFKATSALCRELDSVSAESHPAYAASLYRVLGTVKDPASIPWLEGCLKGPKRKEVREHWLAEWRAYLRGAAPTELTWVTGTNEWSRFFRAWAASEASETNRLKVLQGDAGMAA